MKAIFTTRLMFWKKQWLSLLFWLLFPLAACLTIIHLTDNLQDDVQIPIGIVFEEESPKADKLLKELEQTELVRPTLLSEEEALHQLEVHELDSVFIIHEGYEEQIKKGNRNNLVTGIQSNLSIAYSTVKEMVISMVQEETVRSKAALTVMGLDEQYRGGTDTWSFDEIISKTNEIQEEENLITNNFQFNNSIETTREPKLIEWNTLGLWAIFSLLSSLLLMDWMIKEKNTNTFIRFSFIKIPWHRYLLYNLGVYYFVFVLIDLITIFIIEDGFTFHLWGVLLSFRLMALLLSFLIALFFKNKFIYYGTAFALTLFISVISGVIIPIDGLINNLEWLQILNPIYSVQSNEFTISWLVMTTLLLLLWFIRKEFQDA